MCACVIIAEIRNGNQQRNFFSIPTLLKSKNKMWNKFKWETREIADIRFAAFEVLYEKHNLWIYYFRMKMKCSILTVWYLLTYLVSIIIIIIVTFINFCSISVWRINRANDTKKNRVYFISPIKSKQLFAQTIAKMKKKATVSFCERKWLREEV